MSRCAGSMKDSMTRLADDFVRPVKIDVVGQLAQGDVGDRHRQGNHDCREEAPVLDEREHTMNIVDKFFHRKEARGVYRVARKAETPTYRCLKIWFASPLEALLQKKTTGKRASPRSQIIAVFT